MITKEHLTPNRMRALKDGTLSREEAIIVLEHIGECEQCADAFAENYSDQELLEPLPPRREHALSPLVDREFAYDLVLENAIVGVSYMRERRFVWANTRMCEIFGYKPGELIGHSVIGRNS